MDDGSSQWGDNSCIIVQDIYLGKEYNKIFILEDVGGLYGSIR